MSSQKVCSRHCHHRLVTDDSPFIAHLPVPYKPLPRHITPVHAPSFLSCNPHSPCRPHTQARTSGLEKMSKDG